MLDDNVEIIPVPEFLRLLWNDKIIV